LPNLNCAIGYALIRNPERCKVAQK
jgi:hypothetical protein